MASGRIVLTNSVRVGYRFHPTDEEIVSYFLKNKMLGNDHLVQRIREVDVRKYEPWELPNFSVVKSDDPEWFFFSTREFKYCHGGRSNRTTRDGFWKATGKDRKIKARRTKNVIGTKKTLVYHKGRVPNGVRTNWVMHEYHSVDDFSQRTVYVVCRLKKKDDVKVDKSANDECEDDNVDSYLQSRTIESAMPEVWPEENGGLLLTPLLPEANNELLCRGAHLNWEDETDVDEFVDSLIVDGEEHFVNSLILDREEHYVEKTADPFDNLFIQSQWTGSTHLEGAILSRDTNLEATRLLYGDLPPNSSAIGESSSWSVQSMEMTRKSRGRMFQSKHLRSEQDIIFHCKRATVPLKKYAEQHINTISDGRAVPRIRLQRTIGNTAANPIKAEEASKCTSTDGRNENETRTRPPSEYFVNVIVGIILFIVFVREMVLYGEWGI